MLTKCVNPLCSVPFRRLNEGKLFLVDSEGKARDNFDPRKRKPPRHIEYFWLCTECARLVTLTFDYKAGLMTIPIPPSQQTGLVETKQRPVTAERAAGMLARAAGYHHD